MEEIVPGRKGFEISVKTYGSYYGHDDINLLDGDSPVPVDVVFYSSVRHYAFDHSTYTVDDTFNEYLAYTDFKETTTCRLYDAVRKWSLLSGVGILSEKLSAANPKITPRTDFHNDIVIAIVKKVNSYSDREPKGIGRLKLLTVDVEISEKVWDHCWCGCDDCFSRCECEACTFRRDSILMPEMEAEKLLVPASESSIKKLLKRVRVVAANSEEGDHEGRQRKRMRGPEPSANDDCVICFDEFIAGKYAAQMPCFHSFHGPCIEKWLRRNHLCPLCRYEMPVSD